MSQKKWGEPLTAEQRAARKAERISARNQTMARWEQLARRDLVDRQPKPEGPTRYIQGRWVRYSAYLFRGVVRHSWVDALTEERLAVDLEAGTAVPMSLRFRYIGKDGRKHFRTVKSAAQIQLDMKREHRDELGPLYYWGGGKVM